jgi:chitodextrinase
MAKRIILIAVLSVLSAGGVLRAQPYELIFSTYLGGSDWEHARDVVVDTHGNVYMVGGTASADFPTTPGAYQRTLSVGGSQAFGPCDVFVAKFGPDGGLIWSTYIGGPHYDRAYGVEVDGRGYVYVAGRAGPGFPVKNAFQPNFDGVDNGSYGMQNAFVLKLLPDGSDLVWSSYVGVNTLCRDLAIDANGDVYVPGGRWNTTKRPPSEWFVDAYQKAPPGGQSDSGAIKIKGDGSGVLWATWLGGSGRDESAASIRVGQNGYVYVGGSTFSHDFPTTTGAADQTYSGEADFFVACLTADGSDLVYGTYLGGPGNEWISTHNLAVDDVGNAYAAMPTGSPNYPTTPGALQQTFRGGNTDWAVTKLSPTGALLASTLIGGSAGENADGVYVDSSGNVFITGETQSPDFPTTADAYQRQSHGGAEAVVVVLSADFKKLLYSTFMGGSAYDNGRSGCLGRDGSLYLTGASNSFDWPTDSAFQSTFAGGGGEWGNGDCILAKFVPGSAITIDPSITYQTITGWEATAWVAEPNDPAFPYYKDTLFDQLVNDIGINRVRLEIRSGVENSNDNWSDYQAGGIDYDTWRSRRYATVNDNGDPCEINWAGFHFSEMDYTVENVVLPIKQLVEARGERLFINLNYVAFTGQITGGGTYLHDDPGEYAEFVLAAYLHLQNKYGWVPDTWEVLLEPDNVAQWNGTLLGQVIVAAAGRLKANGFTPSFIAPSNTNMANAINYFDQMVQVPGAVQYLREFSYHRYGGVSDTNLQAIASRAVQHNINTSMLEWWFDNATYHILHKDLTMGRNSAWQQAVVRGFFTIDDSNPNNPVVSVKDVTKFNRQYYKFVRPGAVRIDATSNLSSLDPLAFINDDGKYVVVVKCDAGGAFVIRQLPAGTYGVKYTTAGQYDVDLPDQVIGAGQALSVSIPAAGVLTAYAKATSSDAEPPTVPTGLVATAVSPSQINLNWTASTDNVGVAGYKIYRDNVRIAFWPGSLYTDTGLSPSTTYTYTVSAYDAAGNESGRSLAASAKTPGYEPAVGLLGFWRLDEAGGVTAADSSGHYNDGTIIGAAWTQGRVEQGLDFDGVNDYVCIRADPALDNLDAVTMSAWIYPRVDAHWHVLDKGDGDKRIYAEGANLTLNGRIRYTGTHAYSESVGNTVTLDAWQHVAMAWSRSDGTTRLYRNGVEIEYAIQDIGSGSVLDDTSYPFVVGTRGALRQGYFFDGIIDEVRLYDRAFSAQEVWDLYDCTPSPRRGDLNDDYGVDFTDVVFLTAAWLWAGPAGLIEQDIVRDGIVNLADLAKLAGKWLNRWNQPPLVNIIAPQDGAHVYYGRATEIVADAVDLDGSVVRVEFFVDGSVITEDNDGTDGWQAVWQVPAQGSFALSAEATDDDGATATSPIVTVQAQIPPR